jgi:hypothetical protein
MPEDGNRVEFKEGFNIPFLIGYCMFLFYLSTFFFIDIF